MSSPDPEAVRAFFGTNAYLADNPLIPVRAALVSALLPDLQGARMLDLGSGDGSLSRPFLAHNHVTLVDFSPNMLAHARALTPAGASVEFVEADLLEFSLRSDYDVVLCIGVLAHVRSVADTIARVAAGLRPGGCGIVQITDDGRLPGWFLNSYARLRPRSGRTMNVMSYRSLVAHLTQHGLHPTASRRYGLSVPGTGRLPRALQYRIERSVADSSALSLLGSEMLVLAEKRVRSA